MGAVIDSSVLIAVERGKLDLNRVLADYGDEPVAIATITASELLHGVHRAARRAAADLLGEPDPLRALDFGSTSPTNGSLGPKPLTA